MLGGPGGVVNKRETMLKSGPGWRLTAGSAVLDESW